MAVITNTYLTVNPFEVLFQELYKCCSALVVKSKYMFRCELHPATINSIALGKLLKSPKFHIFPKKTYKWPRSM